MRRRPIVRSLLTSLVVATASLAAVGTPPVQADPLGVIAGETLDVTADKLDVNIDQGSAVLQGEVKAVLGDLEVRCPRIDVRYDKMPKIRWAKGTGGVIARIKGIRAKAQVVEVNVAKRQIELRGGVRLTRGPGWVRAERAVIDIATRRVTLKDVKGSFPVEPPAR